MKIKDAEWVKLYVDDGEESKKVRDALEEKWIIFGERKWRGDFSTNATIRAGRALEGKKLGASTTLSPPVLEVYFGPGKILWLEGLEEILDGIESEW